MNLGSYYLSIVVPVKDERENLPLLYTEIREALKNYEKHFEIVIVNDGSTDGTTEILRDLARNDPHLHAITFRRNFGQTAAIAAGFKAAKGEIVVAMDGDLQNDPNDVLKLVAKIEEGYDLVSGWRKDRKDKTFSRKIPSQIANCLIAKTTGVYLHDYGCSLKAYRKVILNNMELYGEMHRFLPALAFRVGAKILELPVNHRARQHGKTKYNITRTFRVVLDLVTVKFLSQFSTRPLHMIGMPGLGAFLLGGILALYLATLKIVFHEEIGSRPLLLLSVLLITLGAQFVSMGLIAELIARVYHESSGKSIYVVRDEIINGIFYEKT